MPTSLLKVDLSSGTISVERIPEDFVRDYIGASGLGVRLLWDALDPSVDPLDPRSSMLWITGPLTGTGGPTTGRFTICARSPQTGLWGESNIGGFVGPELRCAGYDGVWITGRASEPVYLWITNEGVEIRPAVHLWGRADIYAVQERIRAEVNQPRAKVASIGLAGENQVPFAAILSDHGRAAARTGMGALMGSKNLKAILVRGTRRVSVAQPARFMDLTRLAYADLSDGPGSAEFRQWGTVGGVIDDSEKGALPTYNFQQASFPGVDGIHGPQHKQWLWLRDTACPACPISCGKVSVIRRGTHRGMVAESVDYEVAATMGSNLGLERVEELQYAAYLCDLYGMDAMSTGVVVSFAIEAFERGLISQKDLAGLRPAFGDGQTVHRLIEMIARREEIGALLAEGVKRASQQIGGEAMKIAMHTKGLETPGYEPRGLPGHALGYAVADRGGCHERGYLVHYEMRGALFEGKPVDRFSREGKAQILTQTQNHTAGNDTLIACHFAGEASARYAALLSAATGQEIESGGLDLVGERIWNVTRLFNVREGFSRADDELPPRVKEEGLPDPPVLGQRVTQADLDAMLDDYYQLRGWDNAGVPTKAKLSELGLDILLNMDAVHR